MDLPNPKTFPCTPDGYRAYYKEVRECGRDAFFSHFEGGSAADEYFSRSRRTWELNFAPYLIEVPHDRRDVALEIGSGGGGLLAAASRYFADVVGVDVHREKDFVLEELRRRGVDSVEILDVEDDLEIKLIERSVDFVFSWTALMHLENEAALVRYLAEAHRVLRPRGVAVLYVARVRRSQELQSLNEWLADLADEAAERLMTQVTSTATVNQCRLRCSLWYFEELAREAGFNVGMRMASVRERVGLLPAIGGQQTAVLVRV